MAELIVSLDIDKKEKAEKLVETLGSYVEHYKVGAVPFMAFGMDIVRYLEKHRKKLFFDLKFFDIPNTVEHAVYHVCCLMKPELLTVHISGSIEMLKAAISGRDKSGSKTKIIGVTVLTSLCQKDLELTGINSSVDSQVLRLAQMAYDTGIDGIVCSVRELEFLRRRFPENFLMVCPGIRLGNSDDDQKRIATVAQAVKAGADYLVVGRPVIESKNPKEVVEIIKKQIKENEKKQNP